MTSGAAAAHLAALAAWLGCVLVEAVIEIAGLRRADLRAAAAELHYRIDLAVELPLLAAVVATGLVLAAGRPLDGLLSAKIACGLAAVGANLVCVAFVVARRRAPAARAATLTRRIFATALAGLPPAVAALWLGAQSAAWLR